MSNKDVSYFDAITAININQGVVKLILGSQNVEKITENQGKAAPTPSKVVALPINAFIYTLAVFLKEPKNQDMITKMQEAAGLNK